MISSSNYFHFLVSENRSFIEYILLCFITSVLTQQEACNDMILRYADIDSHLKSTINENKNLRKSLDALEEKLAHQEQLTGK